MMHFLHNHHLIKWIFLTWLVFIPGGFAVLVILLRWLRGPMPEETPAERHRREHLEHDGDSEHARRGF